MKQTELNEFIKVIKLLTNEEKGFISDALEQKNESELIINLIESRFASQECCPNCASVDFNKFGFANDLQRYRCKDCKKTFNALTGTPLSRLRMKENWLAFMQELIESNSVRKAAKGLDIDKNTAFLWRHRFLAWISEEKATSFSGITEADETYFLYSEKGTKQTTRPPRKRGGNATKRGLSKEQVCVLVARDRNGNTADFKVGMGNISTESLNKCLLPRLSEDTLLVSDANKAYLKFSKDSDITYEAVKSTSRVKGAFHIQNVNSYHSRLKNWMNPFNGVATKYLENYLGWRRVLDMNKNLTIESLLKKSMGDFQHLTMT